MTDHIKIELRSLSNEFKSEDSELKVSGYVNKVGEWSEVLVGKPKTLKTVRKVSWKERILPGVFTRALEKAKKVDFLAEHDPKLILSSTRNGSLQLIEDDLGLYMEANISATSWGKDYYTLISDRIIQGMSFGMRVLKDKWYYEGTELRRDIEEIEIFEISAVKNPAYPVSTLESRGIDVEENVVPDEIEEERGLDNNVTELTPQDFYKVLLKIEEKLTVLLNKEPEKNDQGQAATEQDSANVNEEQENQATPPAAQDEEEKSSEEEKETSKDDQETENPQSQEDKKEDEGKKDDQEESEDDPKDDKESDEGNKDSEEDDKQEEDPDNDEEDKKKKKNPFEKRSNDPGLQSLVDFFKNQVELMEE